MYRLDIKLGLGKDMLKCTSTSKTSGIFTKYYIGTFVYAA